MTQREPGPLSAEVDRLCRRLRAEADVTLGEVYTAVLERLAGPLRVAVVGRVSSGKSTLVNALIGRRVAVTSAGERTHLVTRFRYGTVDHVEVVTRDGLRRALPFEPDGTIPTDGPERLGIAAAAVSHLDVHLTNELLRDLTVIDTPGLGSPDPAVAARTRAVVDPGSGTLDEISERAVRGAEAVVYVLTQTVRRDDQDVLGAFAAATAGRHPGPANAIAVLNKIDTIAVDSVAGARDRWDAARTLADRHAEGLGIRVTGVIPVIGLLAETTESGVFGAADAEALRRLAGPPAPDPAVLTLSADLFVTAEAPVDEAPRRRLWALLGRHGILTALEILRENPGITTGDLRRRLNEESGIGRLRTGLDTVFRLRADGIKAAAGLASLAAIADTVGGRPVERDRIRDGIEELLARPDAHRLRVLETLTAVGSGAVRLPGDLTAEVARVCGGGTPAERLGMVDRSLPDQLAHALERAGWWRSFSAFGATPAQSRVAYIVHRTYFLLWRQLTDGGTR